ncbi:hypothetical protein [Clostridium felsineum]|uniref:Uncharacterized protein n=1 Tax=Clostridium felsineum TaxID=36839 RepID=A0A1S8L4M2_9CLOT|nr:hypothetical protein [Clostridium felsineum]URZ06741.1 hypothetical protein CLROS_020740 [Clostridium felsineum]URZ11774.1 hypothetical protein CROST_024910 [Clostridium felsineum]
MNIEPISPEVVDDKLTKVVFIIYKTVTGIIYPLALLGYATALIFIVMGALIHSKTIKKIGVMDLGIVTLTLIFYFCMPTFIGILKTIENIMK